MTAQLGPNLCPLLQLGRERLPSVKDTVLLSTASLVLLVLAEAMYSAALFAPSLPVPRPIIESSAMRKSRCRRSASVMSGDVAPVVATVLARAHAASARKASTRACARWCVGMVDESRPRSRWW